MRIVTIGEILIDLTQTGYNQQNIPMYAANPGGAPANVAVAASRLGADTAFVGMVGSDGFGTYLAQVLKDNGVSTQGLRVGQGATTLAVVSVNAQGERSFQFMRGADANLTADQVDRDLIAGAGIVHFGSVSLTADPARSATLHACQQVEVIQLGGIVRHTSTSVIGDYAERMLGNFSCSKLFLGVDGIDLKYGLTTTNSMEASVNRVMIEAAQKTIVLSDSSKFGRRGFGKICNLDVVDQIITDSGVAPKVVEDLEDMGIKVTIV